VNSADRSAIRDLVEAYAAAVDRADGAAVAALFVPDGRLVLWMAPGAEEPTGVRQGRTEIGAAVDGIARYRATHHTVSSVVVNGVDRDTARGETRCAAHHVEETDGEVRDRVLYIRYDDTFRRDGDGWRFQRREVRVQWVSLLPVQT
jgi:uncharacterized protein (TIGR02246 family)